MPILHTNCLWTHLIRHAQLCPRHSLAQCSSHRRFSSQPSEQQHQSNITSSPVPSTKIGRFVQYGGLAAGLGAGAVSEKMKRLTGISTPLVAGSSSFLSPDNIHRIVRTLTQMRGAALKLGQMISIQDIGVLPPELEKILSQVQNGANYMPRRQMRQVMHAELGPDWESKFDHFDYTPFAAASIGQVHKATLKDGRLVAVKVQYPGVANSIDSDLAHLKSIGLMAGFLPKGLFLDNSMEVARRELMWETDYVREANWMLRFHDALKSHPVVQVPEPIMHLSTGKVLTMTYATGVTLGHVAEMDTATRTHVAQTLLEFTLMELFQLMFMQTDPNWSNFLYDPESRKIKLLDFGSAREYSADFLAVYAKVLKAAADQDPAAILNWSKELGFITGYETLVMKQAYTQSVLALGAPFTVPVYDFVEAKKLTKQVRDLIPTMLEHRLNPPPDESYSLHRKVSGVFLLCTRLGVKLPCRDLLLGALDKFDREHQSAAK